MIIQTLLIILSLAILLYFLINRNAMRVRAYKKVGLLLFVALMIGLILVPDNINRIAHAVGVGRGADLMLYLLLMAFVGFALNVYLKFKEQQAELYKLARKIALVEAESKNEK